MVRGICGIIAGVLVAAVVVAGCGGSDDDPITKAEFVKEADAICQQRENQKNKAVSEGLANRPKDLSEAEFEEKLVLETALPPIAAMTEELAALDVPEGQEQQVEKMIAAFEKEVETLEGEPNLVAENEGGYFDEADALAKKLGLKECSVI